MTHMTEWYVGNGQGGVRQRGKGISTASRVLSWPSKLLLFRVALFFPLPRRRRMIHTNLQRLSHAFPLCHYPRPVLFPSPRARPPRAHAPPPRAEPLANHVAVPSLYIQGDTPST